MAKSQDLRHGFQEGQEATVRPAVVTDAHLTFLDELRESGETNMFGARPYLMEEFPGLSTKDAATVVAYWMKTFGKPSR